MNFFEQELAVGGEPQRVVVKQYNPNDNQTEYGERVGPMEPPRRCVPYVVGVKVLG